MVWARRTARLFAAEGAAVVVNDLGGARDGTGASLSAAQSVVQAIEAAGGRACPANGDERLDPGRRRGLSFAAPSTPLAGSSILVNNAGILRDKTFANTSEADWDGAVVKVHLKGPIASPCRSGGGCATTRSRG